MNFIHRLIRTLILPNNAGAGQARMVLGPDLPPPLNTYLFNSQALATSAIIFYSGIGGDSNFTFLAMVPIPAGNTIVLYLGQVAAGAVVETNTGNPAGQAWQYNYALGHEKIRFNIAPAPGDNQDLSLLLPSQASAAHLAMGYRAGNLGNAGILCTTPAGGAETAIPSANYVTEGNPTFMNGRVFCAIVMGYFIESTGGGGTVSFIRLRKGQASVVGTQLGLYEVFHQAGVGGFTGGFAIPFFFVNSSGANVTSRLSVTINGVIGAGTWSLYGDANLPLAVFIEDVCAINDLTMFASLPSV